ncbi:GNAT family N-acetyltransferase [Nocardia wallacei]|uniref:GNAT family N-acetyltransferase n=1 Tax=Nocardia wallacei TaxID=480035 RepID=UPI002454B85A|nr:GNAT family N-acetyltransferase [Nocardia wallacei]
MSDIPVIVDRAGLWDAEALSDVAAATFPLACPPELAPEDIDTFIARILSGDRFGDYLSDPGRTVLKAVAGGDIVGYAMLVAGPPADPEIAAAMGDPMVEINKLYVLPDHHGAGVWGAPRGGGGGAPPRRGGGGGARGRGWWPVRTAGGRAWCGVFRWRPTAPPSTRRSM